MTPEFAKAKQHIKTSFMDLLFTLNIKEKGRIVVEIESFMKNKEQLLNFVRHFLGAFSEVEFMSDYNNSGTNKYKYRYYSVKFLLTALKRPSYIEAFRQCEDTKEGTDFLGHLIVDLNFFLEDVFENLEKIQKLQSEDHQQHMQDIQEMESQVNQNASEIKSTAKNHLKFGRTYFRLFEEIAQIDYKFFENTHWVAKVANLINFYSERMSTKSYKKYKFSGINELGLKPLQFITSLINIYYYLSKSSKIKAEIVNDERSYSKEVLRDIGMTAYNKHLVSGDVLDAFENLIFDLDYLKEEKDIYNKIISDCPDKFNCGLTYELMKEPVLLPSSKLVVDKSAI